MVTEATKLKHLGNVFTRHSQYRNETNILKGKNMNNENVPVVQHNLGMPNPQEFQMLQVIAKNAQDSGLYAGVGQQAKIFMVLLAARELGISPMLALNGGIWNIQGKIEISARLMNGLIRRAGHSIKIIVSNDEICTLLGTRNDGDSFECSFSMADANKAGLSGGNVWKKYPADMLYNRCMSRLARRLFPDVIGTAYIEGEIREAKEVEKLEKIEYEEVKKVASNTYQDHLDTNMNQDIDEPKISLDQLTEILRGLTKVDGTTLKNCKDYVKNTWNIEFGNYENLPESAFMPLIKGIQYNIEMNSKKAVENASN